MYIWKLARVNVVTPGPDTLRSVVVVAETDSQARLLAAAVAGDEGRSVWSDDCQADCLAIGDANPVMLPYPGVICRDFQEA